jgi:hypothetical protein
MDLKALVGISHIWCERAFPSEAVMYSSRLFTSTPKTKVRGRLPTRGKEGGSQQGPHPVDGAYGADEKARLTHLPMRKVQKTTSQSQPKSCRNKIQKVDRDITAHGHSPFSLGFAFFILAYAGKEKML